jgi:hypothetical protein
MGIIGDVARVARTADHAARAREMVAARRADAVALCGQSADHRAVAVRLGGAPVKPSELIRGDWLLNLADAWVGKHVHMRNAARHAITLWTVAQHFRQAVQPSGSGAQQRIRMVMVWDKFGRVMLIAETPGSGKTTTMKVAGYLCAPYFQGIDANPTAPGLCLTIAQEDAVVFIDEAHRLVGPRGTRKADVVTIACVGVEQDATYLNGRGGKANRVPVYAPMMIAGRDDLVKSAGEEIADLIDRSVLIRMSQPPADVPELLPVTGKTRADGALIAGKIAQWAAQEMADGERFEAALARARKAAKDTGLHGRSADVWLPMFTVAMLADMDRAEAERGEGGESGEDGYAVLPESEDGHLAAACKAAVELRLNRPVVREDDRDPLKDLEAMLGGEAGLPSWGGSFSTDREDLDA